MYSCVLFLKEYPYTFMADKTRINYMFTRTFELLVRPLCQTACSITFYSFPFHSPYVKACQPESQAQRS